MKKKFGVALILALALILCLSPTTALAWDFEDAVVAANEDFIQGGSVDDGVGEFHGGEQPWAWPKLPSDGYNLYRDDVTDTGNLDAAFILTYTPNEVDLPIIWDNLSPDGVYWFMGDESLDTWYWALEPRGYNTPSTYASEGNWYYGDFMVRIFTDNSYRGYTWSGNPRDTLVDPVEQVATFYYNGRTTYKLMIPEGTTIKGLYGSWAWYLELRIIEEQFHFSPNLTLSQPASVYELVDNEWVEILTFNTVLSGKASLVTALSGKAIPVTD